MFGRQTYTYAAEPLVPALSAFEV